MTGEIGSELARTRQIEAEAKVEIAKATHQEPARLKERRKVTVSIVVTVAILLILVAAVCRCEPPDLPKIFIAGIFALGTAWGIPAAVQAWKRD